MGFDRTVNSAEGMHNVLYTEESAIQGVVHTEREQSESGVVHPLGHERMPIDLDDGVKVNNKPSLGPCQGAGFIEWR